MRRFIRKPFKGHSAYEWQVGPFVLMWFHKAAFAGTRESRKRYYNSYLNAYLWEIKAGRFLVWNDPLWHH